MKLIIGVSKNIAVYVMFSFFMLFHTGLQAGEICDVTIDCPGNYDGDTLVLPDNIVMLSKTFMHCSPTFFDEKIKPGSVDTISLFFIIDHSASMSVFDSNSNRYSVTSKIIDSLSAISNVSEIGIAIFSNQLMHNYQIDSYAKQLNPASGWTDSYIPLTKLNSQVNGKSAKDYLKSVIQTSNEKDIGKNSKLVNGYYGQSGRISYSGGTDISLGFEAAREAFKTASYPNSKRYIIFFSDGHAQTVDEERKPQIDNFVAGTNTPTTFTVWLNSLDPIHQQISTMTQNIKTNNYSETNKSSTVWKSSGNASDLLTRLLKITLPGSFGIIKSKPISLSINGISAIKFDDSLAYLPSNIIFSNPTTTLDILFSYRYESPWDIDSTKKYKVVISSKPGAILPADLKTHCWEQGKIAFHVDGSEVKGTILDDNKKIEVRFYPPVEMPPTGNVVLIIKNKNNSDTLALQTASNGTYYYATFEREYGTPNFGDSKLQNIDNDSIIAIYVNPDIPLDIVKDARKVGPARNIIPTKAWYLDENADGYPDVIRVIQGEKFIPDELEQLLSNIYLSSPEKIRPIKISKLSGTNNGFDIAIAPGGGADCFTGVYKNEQLCFRAIANLKNGGSLPAMSVIIEDSMAPVIVTASFITRTKPVNGDGRYDDTLNIQFSENVPSIDNQTPFKFEDLFMLQYSMTLKHLSTNNKDQKFLVTNISADNKPGLHDSVWINETAGVGDVNKKNQTNANNRKVEIYKVPLKYTFSAVVCPVPADPKTAVVPSSILNSFDNIKDTKGIAVIVSSGQQISSTDTVSATISIFDQLGFPVIKDANCHVNKSKVLFIWNGSNKNKRIVGNGIYTAVIKIKVSNGSTETLKTKIGVLHE